MKPSKGESFDHWYEILHRIAQSLMRTERPGHTLGPTDLVHLVFSKNLGDYDSDTGFISHATHCMKQVLIDHARARARKKRGGGEWKRVPLRDEVGKEDESLVRYEERDAFERSLHLLATENFRAALVVICKFHHGMTHQEIADLFEVSKRTIDRDWEFALAFLFGLLRDEFEGPASAAAG